MKARPARTSHNNRLELALRKCSNVHLCSCDTNTSPLLFKTRKVSIVNKNQIQTRHFSQGPSDRCKFPPQTRHFSEEPEDRINILSSFGKSNFNHSKLTNFANMKSIILFWVFEIRIKIIAENRNFWESGNTKLPFYLSGKSLGPKLAHNCIKAFTVKIDESGPFRKYYSAQLGNLQVASSSFYSDRYLYCKKRSNNCNTSNSRPEFRYTLHDRYF